MAACQYAKSAGHVSHSEIQSVLPFIMRNRCTRQSQRPETNNNKNTLVQTSQSRVIYAV